MIVTSRLTLKPPSMFSVPVVVGWLNNHDVMRYSEQRHAKHSKELQWEYMKEMREPNRYLEIHCGKSLIGTLSAYVDKNNDVADVGILIGEKSAWGKGYGTEAWRAFCDHLLGNGIRKIEAGCMNTNFGMIHIFRKAGMYYEGRRTAHFVSGEDTVDMVMYGKFRN